MPVHALKLECIRDRGRASVANGGGDATVKHSRHCTRSPDQKRDTMKKLAVAVALAGLSALAAANTITYTLSGVITASPTDEIAVGTAFSFVANIDSGALPDWNPSPGRYEWAMMSNSELMIGSSILTVDPAKGAVALDENSSAAKNSFVLNEYSSNSPTVALSTSASLDGIRIYDVTAALANSAPPGPPFKATSSLTTVLGSLSDWRYRQLSFEVFSQDILTPAGEYAYLGDVDGDITSFSVSSTLSVPEPSCAALFILGFTGIASMARRKRPALRS